MVRFIGSVNPFKDKAQEYKNKGWTNPVPLPPKAKEPPPTGFTGRAGKEVTQDVLDNWLEKAEHGANLGLHLGFSVARSDGTGSECVIGIDVDDNEDNPERPKTGGTQLKKIERVLGKLPDTWISSARDDGISGIRFFIAPGGLEWRGNCGDAGGPHIDIVSKQHKYSVVFPSIHPNGGQYVWYPPGVKPLGINYLSETLNGGDWDRIGSGYKVIGGTAIPLVADLARLPDKWVDFLTRGRIEDRGAWVVDMDSGLKELQNWAKNAFVAGTGRAVDERFGRSDDIGGMCKALADAVAKHLERIDVSEERHYPLQDAHWHLLSLGAEGHHGWLNAVKAVEKAWLSRIESELASGGTASSSTVGLVGTGGSGSGARTMDKARKELMRSREGALRKLRGKAIQMERDGYSFIGLVETCFVPDQKVIRAEKRKAIAQQELSAMAGGGGSGGGGGAGTSGDVDMNATLESDLEDLARNGPGDGEPPLWLKDVAIQQIPDPSEYEPTDDSQAKFINNVFGDSIRYVSDVKQWMIYDDKTWHIVDDGFAGWLYKGTCLTASRRRALEAKKSMAQHIAQGGVQADAQYKKLKRIASLCQRAWDKYSNLAPTMAVLKSYSAIPGKSMGYGQLNWRDDVLAMPNGKVVVLQRRSDLLAGKGAGGSGGSGGSGVPATALQTGVWGYRIEDNRKEYYTTMQTAANYVGYKRLSQSGGLSTGAGTTRGQRQIDEWNRTLELILPDKELRDFTQRVFGHLILGGNDEKLVVFLAGKPHTGKSTLLNSLGVLGDYYGPFNPANVMDRKAGDGSPNPELISLWFKRVVGNSESGMGTLDAAALKKITGRDELVTRALFSNRSVSGTVHFAPIMATNKAPTIVGGDQAVINRLLVIPIETVIRTGVDDKSFTSKVVERCKYAIWLWLLEGYKAYVRLGLDRSGWPTAVAGKTEGFSSEMSDVASFLSQVCEIADEEVMDVINRLPHVGMQEKKRVKLDSWCQLSQSELYDAYLRWNGQGERHLKQRRFMAEIRGFGIEPVRRSVKGEKVWKLHGIKINHKAFKEITGGTIRGL